MFLSGDFASRGHIDAYFTAHRVTPRIVMEANSVQALVEIVQRTPLAAVLPDAVTHDHPHLSPVPLRPALPPREVTLLRRTQAYRSAAVRAFTRLLDDVVGRRGYRAAGPGPAVRPPG